MNRLEKETKKARQISIKGKKLIKERDLLEKEISQKEKQLSRIENKLHKYKFALSQYEMFVYDYYNARPYLLKSIKILNLPKNIFTHLKKNNISCIEDLLNISKKQLAQINLNKDDIDIIRQCLKQHNACLKGEANNDEKLAWKD